MNVNAQILVAGGGLAGRAAALRLAASGARVALADPDAATDDTPPPRADGRPAGRDLRTTAVLQPSIATLSRAGAWGRIAPLAEPLWTMRLVDAGGRVRTPRETADFEARSLMDRPFGYNVPNAAAREAMAARIAEEPRITRIAAAVTDLVTRSTEVQARLGDGSVVRARLLVAADGRESAVRRLAGIGIRRWSYAQRALVFCVSHPEPHRGISTEIHRTGGPCTLVPMPDLEDRPASSVVWMMPAARARALETLDDAALGAALTAETMGLMGPLRVEGPRAAWPIIGQIATRLRANRVAIAAEAAHVIPPIGAQGLNMSLADVECLARLVEDGGHGDPGSEALLSAYERRRLPEVAARVAGVDLLNRFAETEWQPLRDLRYAGLAAIHRIGPLRRAAMRFGLGAGV